MNDLSEFLLARIVEDEEWQRRDDCDCAMEGFPLRHGASCPVKILAECDAKRQIVEMHAANGTAYPPRFDQFDPHSITVCASCGESREPFHKPGCTTLRLLALPYADHPDYDQAWKS